MATGALPSALRFAGPLLNIGSGAFNLAEGNIEQGAGTLGGTATGALIGSIFPGIGTLLGASIGGGAGGFLGGLFGGGSKPKRPSASARSFAAGSATSSAFQGALNQANSLPTIAQVLQIQAPHGEFQTGSGWNAERGNWAKGIDFGWAGDWDDPASPQWTTAIARLSDPTTVQTDPEFVTKFIEGLWIQGPGQTGAVPYNDALTKQTQDQMMAALPNLPVYQEFKKYIATKR